MALSFKSAVSLSFKGFAAFSLLVELYLIYLQNYIGKSQQLLQVNHQLLDFVGQAPIKEVKVYKEEKDFLKNNYTPLSLFWSQGFEGYCAMNGEFTKSCKNEKAVYVDKELPKVYRRWRGGVYLWVSRYRDEEIKRKRDGEKCPTGWKDCGFNLCVKKYEECPVTDLKIDADSHYNANSTEYKLLPIKEGKVLVVERRPPQLNTGFINDLIVTMNTVPCRARNINGTKKSADTTLDIFPSKAPLCDESHPELISNYKLVDEMNRRKFNEFNMDKKFAENLPTSEAVKYKTDEMLLSASIYSIKSTEPRCDSVNVLNFASKVSDHSNNAHRLKNFLYIKAAIFLLVIFVAHPYAAVSGCIIGIVYNYFLNHESGLIRAFAKFYNQDLSCFFNVEHFASVSTDVLEKPLSLIDTAMFKQAMVVYSVFLVLVVVVILRDKKPTEPRYKSIATADKKEKDEGDAPNQSKPASAQRTTEGEATSRSPTRKPVQRE